MKYRHFTNEQRNEYVKGMENAPDRQAYADSQNLWLSQIYGWRNAMSKSAKSPMPKTVEFNIVSEKEARLLVPNFIQGRFFEFKQNLKDQLNTLPKGQALLIQGPSEEKEIHSWKCMLYSTLFKIKPKYSVRFNRLKNLFIILRKNSFNGVKSE